MDAAGSRQPRPHGTARLDVPARKRDAVANPVVSRSPLTTLPGCAANAIVSNMTDRETRPLDIIVNSLKRIIFGRRSRAGTWAASLPLTVIILAT